jgi:multiple sugar transport system substrate-binding protein
MPVVVGQSAQSYHLGDNKWAIPMDAAAQISVARPDLVKGSAGRLGSRASPRLGGADSAMPWGPHTLLMLAAVCLAPAVEPAAAEDAFVERSTGVEALTITKAILVDSVVETSALNPIQVLELMTQGGRPLVLPARPRLSPLPTGSAR